jgi:endonuclease/exonuclease/phosphatase family metal-dependent hydrolase
MKALRCCAIGLLGLAMVAGCSRRDERPADYPPLPGRGEFSVMSFNLDRFAMADRDGNGQPDNFKPREEIDAVVEMIRQARPYILAVQEIGNAAALQTLRDELAAAGLDYPHADHLAAGDPLHQLAVLSRFPLKARAAITNLTYTIQGETLPVSRGFQQVDIEIAPETIVRIINVHLKSKTFHPAGQTEMRRNEARLLATYARRVMREDPQLAMMLCGTFNDVVDASALRELTTVEGGGWRALDIRDQYGDNWTRDDRDETSFERVDFMLVQQDKLGSRFIADKTRVIRTPEARIASNHRPLLATFSVD